MAVYVLNTLPRGLAILYRDIQCIRTIDTLNHARHALYGGKEVGDLSGCKRREARDDAARADEDVAGEEGLEVDEGIAERREVEDLCGDEEGTKVDRKGWHCG